MSKTRHTRSRGSTWHLVVVLAVAVGFAAFFVLRFHGYWAESDTGQFARFIHQVGTQATIQTPAPYPHGFGYQVWGFGLQQILGARYADLVQLYLPTIGLLMLAIVSFALFRRILASDAAGMAATVTLFLVPEVLFTFARGNHEKLTGTLLLIAILAVTRSLEGLSRPSPWASRAAWIGGYHIASVGLVATHVFFGSTVILGMTAALVVALVARPVLGRLSGTFGAVAPRLAMATAASWAMVALVVFFVYAPATENLRLFETTLERLRALFFTLSPESNPYEVVASDWRDPRLYFAVTAFRWVLFAGSFGAWITILIQAMRGRRAVTTTTAFLLAMYGAFGLQLVLSILIDLVGLDAGSNLQVRLFSYFAYLAAPMLVLGAMLLSGSSPTPRGPIARIVALGLVLLLGAASVAKLTLEPAISNRWLTYSPMEIEAIQSFDALQTNDLLFLWIGTEPRLRYAYNLEYPEQSFSNRNLRAGPILSDHAFFLDSWLIRSNALAWGEVAPNAANENLVLDNGGARLFRKVPRTPYQR